MTACFRICLTTSCAVVISALAGCKTPAANCAGFREARLSPAGTVALIQADRAGFERVEGNDAAGRRLGCW